MGAVDTRVHDRDVRVDPIVHAIDRRDRGPQPEHPLDAGRHRLALHREHIVRDDHGHCRVPPDRIELASIELRRVSVDRVAEGMIGVGAETASPALRPARVLARFEDDDPAVRGVKLRRSGRTRSGTKVEAMHGGERGLRRRQGLAGWHGQQRRDGEGKDGGAAQGQLLSQVWQRATTRRHA